MKCYFHCDVNMYIKRVRTFLEYTAAPAVMISMFLTICLLLNIRNLMHSRLLFPAVAIIVGIIFIFALLTRIMIEIAEHRVRVHSKYTYIEIGMKDIIVSLYAGSFTHGRDKTVIRRMLVIPLKAFDIAEVVKGGQIHVKSKDAGIRDYIGNTDRLGYYFKDGTLNFKEYFFEERGFDVEQEVFIPRRFAAPREIVAAMLAAKSRFDNLPAPKPYVFKELPFVKTRKIREKVKHMRNLI